MVDHFRYLAAAARAEEGRSTEIEKDLVAYHFREAAGRGGSDNPMRTMLLCSGGWEAIVQLALAEHSFAAWPYQVSSVLHVANESSW